MAKKRKNRRNPAASARAASERVTYGGAASSRAASAKAASARPVAKPPVDMPLPASAKKKSKAPLILASVFGVAVVGGVAWWLLSKKAEAAEGEFESSGGEGFLIAPRGGYTLETPFELKPEVAEAMKNAPLQKLRRAGIIITPAARRFAPSV